MLLKSSSQNDCNYFDSCNAPLCPLDPDIHQHTMLRGESVCKFWRDELQAKKTCSISGKGINPPPYYPKASQCQNTTLKWALDSIRRVNQWNDLNKGGKLC